MYKQIKTDKQCKTSGGSTFTPVATLADEYGGRCQISIDDHCYVIMLKEDDGTYNYTPWIFKEVFEVLKSLPSLK